MTRPVLVPALPVEQPIGSFLVGVIKFQDLVDISYADMRRIEEGNDRFVGIQRKLRPDRVSDISRFVRSIDATFPTSIVISVPEACASYDTEKCVLTLKETVGDDVDEVVPFAKIANILDGQHRIEGLKSLPRDKIFELPISIFIEPDVSDEAYIFATVNLAQTKVNRSLVYDLLDYARARSPQKSCHDVAVALDKYENSPLRNMIKRLGIATAGRTGETLAQATVVLSLLDLISIDPDADRDALAKKKSVEETTNYQKTPLRPMWCAEHDADIARTLINYFSVVASKWPEEWATRERGHILPRTNGFRALMRFLRNVLIHLRPTKDQALQVVSIEEVAGVFDGMELGNKRLTVDYYAPGTSGETALYKDLRAWSGI
jgi:DGQHR domain-containing protein